MESTSTHKAGPELRELLERVDRGERVTITRQGIPVALIIPAHSSHATEVTLRAIERLKAFPRQPLGDLTIRELIDEGRRSW